MRVKWGQVRPPQALPVKINRIACLSAALEHESNCELRAVWLSPLAMPQQIEFVFGLPRTRSGKSMSRALRAREWGEEIGDTSTLEND